MHKLLMRQLNRHGGSDDAPPSDWHAFIEAIDAAYRQADADRILLERSLDLCTDELTERYQLKQDVARRAEIERNLAGSLALVRSILESTSDGILVLDQHGKIVDWNQLFLDMWQVPFAIVESQDDAALLRFMGDVVRDGCGSGWGSVRGPGQRAQQ
jgi:PAS domain-containing protein